VQTCMSSALLRSRAVPASARSGSRRRSAERMCATPASPAVDRHDFGRPRQPLLRGPPVAGSSRRFACINPLLACREADGDAAGRGHRYIPASRCPPVSSSSDDHAVFFPAVRRCHPPGRGYLAAAGDPTVLDDDALVALASTSAGPRASQTCPSERGGRASPLIKRFADHGLPGDRAHRRQRPGGPTNGRSGRGRRRPW